MSDRERAFLSLATQAGVVVGAPDDANLLGDPLRACHLLFGPRVGQYDAEAIDEPEHYSTVLAQHAALTQGEWQPGEIDIAGELDGWIELRFDLAGQRVKLRFEQEGSDYVSPGFVKKLLQLTAKALPGRFVELPTDSQDLAFVYLPHELAKALKTLLRDADGAVERKVTLESFVRFFRKGGSWSTGHHVEELDFSVNACDKLGDTALTAAVAADNVNGVVDLLSRLQADAGVPDARGRSPWQIALQRGHAGVLQTLRAHAWASMPPEALTGGRKGLLATVIGTHSPLLWLETATTESDLPLLEALLRELAGDEAQRFGDWGRALACLYGRAQAAPQHLADRALALLCDPDRELRCWVERHLLRSGGEPRIDPACDWRVQFDMLFERQHAQLDDEIFRALLTLRLQQGAERRTAESDAPWIAASLRRVAALRAAGSPVPDPALADALLAIGTGLVPPARDDEAPRTVPEDASARSEAFSWIELLALLRAPAAAPLWRWAVGLKDWAPGAACLTAAQMLAALGLPPRDQAEAMSRAIWLDDAAALRQACAQDPAAAARWLHPGVPWGWARTVLKPACFEVLLALDEPEAVAACARVCLSGYGDRVRERVLALGAPVAAPLMHALAPLAEVAATAQTRDDHQVPDGIVLLMRCLGALRHAPALALLRRAASGSYYTRHVPFHALLAMADFEDAALIPDLVEFFGSPELEQRLAVVAALARIDDPRALAALQGLNDTSPKLRKARDKEVARLLARLGLVAETKRASRARKPPASGAGQQGTT